MKVSELTEKIGFEYITGQDANDNEVAGCYIGDLLSLAMAKVEAGNAWITIQTNINVVAVASLKEAACVIVADGFTPDDNAIAKAKTEEIILLSSKLSAYEIAAKLSALGI